jgi:hypothetical protein
MRSVFAAALLSMCISADDRLKELKACFKSSCEEKEGTKKIADDIIKAFDTNKSRAIERDAPNKKEGEEFVKAMMTLWKAEGLLDNC